jgi:hypothetical protein
MLIEGLEALGEIWKVAVATTPSAIAVLFRPKMIQFVPEQETDLPAFVAEAPAITVNPVMSTEYESVHWRPAVWAPPLEATLMGRETVPPGVPEPEPIDSVTLCPRSAIGSNRRIASRRELRTPLATL